MSEFDRTASARCLAASRSKPISMSAKGLRRHGGSGRGSIVSTSLGLSTLIIFNASAKWKCAYDPMLFLRHWACASACQIECPQSSL
jgi:hypothetical protein